MHPSPPLLVTAPNRTWSYSNTHMHEYVHVQMLYDLRDVNKIFILIRPKKKMAPQARANKEIASSPIFARLRAEMGDDFDAYFRSKVVALAGDINKDYMVGLFLGVPLSLSAHQRCLSSYAVSSRPDPQGGALSVAQQGSATHGRRVVFVTRCKLIGYRRHHCAQSHSHQ